MKKSAILTMITAGIALTAGSVFAAGDNMEKCKVVKDGKGLIKAHKADCKGTAHSCAGQNKASDPNTWILVPKGQCEKINAGDFSGVDQATKDKIEGAH